MTDLEKLIADIKLASNVMNHMGTFQTGQGILDKAADTILALQARVEELEGALEDIASDIKRPDEGLADFGERQHYLFAACRKRDIDRAALKGEANEQE